MPTATRATDNFNRVDNVDLGANWTVPATAAGLQIVSNTVEDSVIANSSHEIYTGIAFADNQWAQVQVASQVNTSVKGGVALRGITASETLYSFRISAATDNLAEFLSFIAGTATQFATAAISVSAGDVIRGVAFQTGIFGYKNDVLILSASDSSISSGKPGLTMIVDTIANLALDNWAGGDFPLNQDYSDFPKPKIRDAVRAGWLA